MGTEPLYVLYLLIFLISPIVALLTLYVLGSLRIGVALFFQLLLLPSIAGSFIYALLVFQDAYAKAKRSVGPTNTFATILLTVFLFTVVPDGFWSVLFAKTELVVIKKLCQKSRISNISLMLASMVMGSIAALTYHSLDAFSLRIIHSFYHLEDVSATSTFLAGEIAYSLGGTITGLLAIRGINAQR